MEHGEFFARGLGFWRFLSEYLFRGEGIDVSDGVCIDDFRPVCVWVVCEEYVDIGAEFPQDVGIDMACIESGCELRFFGCAFWGGV